MGRHRGMVWLAGVLAFASCIVSPVRAAEEKASGKLRVVIIDGQNNHNWKVTTPFLKQALEDSGRFTVDVATGPARGGKPAESKGSVAFPPDLTKFDVVLSNYNGEPWPADFQKALEEYVHSGTGALVIVHAANNAFEQWPEYNRMIGMGWRNNKFGDRLIVDDSGKEVRVPSDKGPGAGHGPMHPFLIVVRDPDHPITKGMPREWLHARDELYQGMRGPIVDVHLLATAYADKSKGGTGENEPMIWTIQYGKGRVFHTTMGHDLDAMRCVGFVTTLRRGTEWAGTGKVTIPMPANFPTASQSSSVEAK